MKAFIAILVSFLTQRTEKYEFMEKLDHVESFNVIKRQSTKINKGFETQRLILKNTFDRFQRNNMTATGFLTCISRKVRVRKSKWLVYIGVKQTLWVFYSTLYSSTQHLDTLPNIALPICMLITTYTLSISISGVQV